MNEHVEHFLAIYICCSEWSSQFICQFISWLFVLLVFKFWGPLYILDISPLSDDLLAKIFLHSVGCLFILVFVMIRDFLNLIQSHFSILAFIF
jgi:hypothetical protein